MHDKRTDYKLQTGINNGWILLYFLNDSKHVYGIEIIVYKQLHLSQQKQGAVCFFITLAVFPNED